jgi:hypothetical protein
LVPADLSAAVLLEGAENRKGTVSTFGFENRPLPNFQWCAAGNGAPLAIMV